MLCGCSPILCREPEWVLNCGITLAGDVLPDDKLEVVLQDFLDAIEYADVCYSTNPLGSPTVPPTPPGAP